MLYILSDAQNNNDIFIQLSGLFGLLSDSEHKFAFDKFVMNNKVLLNQFYFLASTSTMHI